MEKNRKILDEALQQLRSYAPDEMVWTNIHLRMAEPKLAEVLSQLKLIDPPEIFWDAIDNELDKQVNK
jgi:hypothetical protein